MTQQEIIGLAIAEGVRQGLSACEAADRWYAGVPFPEQSPGVPILPPSENGQSRPESDYRPGKGFSG